jgi:uncharacterized protein (DUF433 family)
MRGYYVQAYFSRSKICHGQACIKGTRIPVDQIIRMLANGDKIQELLEDYLSIKAEDIYACLDYAASLQLIRDFLFIAMKPITVF